MPSNVPLTRPFAPDSRIADWIETVGEALDRLAMIVVERCDEGVDLVVGGRRERSIEQPQRLETGLHGVHVPRRYRGHVTVGGRRSALPSSHA